LEELVMSTSRKRLSDILTDSSAAVNLAKQWDATEAAGELAPVPAGQYLCRVLSGELFSARTGTPGYKLTLEVAEGEHEGRRLWHDLYLTGAALPMAKRDLAKIGITHIEQLEQPVPQRILLRVRVSLRRDDDGTERNRVVRFEFAGVEPPDAFAPEGGPPDTSFPFRANAPNGESPGPAGNHSPTPGRNGQATPPPPTNAPDGGHPAGQEGKKQPLLSDAGEGPYGERR
jgi:hypothetical protein